MSPPDLSDRLVGVLAADPAVVNLVVLPGVARNPDGDAIECDLLTGAANQVLRSLRDLGVDRRGSVVIEPVELALSERAAQAETHRGALARAPVWDEVQSRIRAGAFYTPSFYLFLAVAGVIGAVGILTNSEILIVGAMVVGPEYAAVVSVASGLDRGAWAPVRKGLSALLGGFTLACLAAYGLGLVVRGAGRTPPAFELGLRPVSHLIDSPNFFSMIVAVLAAVVGVVALTEARFSTMLGVFISVTTIPAASDIGVACAYALWREARGSLLQLLLNLVVLIVVGFLTLRAQRFIWRWVARRRDRAEPAVPDG
ncbi:DUF389 domain-containing protein [Catellatospora coxensis]|uniref:DUF389 domain-containing protein n=1 Tax=Catellatospora coxensis TaxID=310354 RepID=UPI001EF1F906|nr:DUF389 domain-containing protein [Catellatospora coxensis]